MDIPFSIYINMIILLLGQLQWPPWCCLLLRVRGDVHIRAGRRAQVPGLEGGAAGPGRAQGHADCDKLTPLRHWRVVNVHCDQIQSLGGYISA